MYIERYLSEIASSGTASETAFYTPLSIHILRGLLNYPAGKCLINVSGESGIPDVRLRSLDDDSEWVVCDAQLDDREVQDDARRGRIWRDQVLAKHYLSAETVYVLICSPHAFRVLDTKGQLVAGADLDLVNRVLTDSRTGEDLPLTDAGLREALGVISARASEERSHYEQFRLGELDGGYISLTAETVGLLRPVFDFALRELKAYCRECYLRCATSMRRSHAKWSRLRINWKWRGRIRG